MDNKLNILSSNNVNFQDYMDNMEEIDSFISFKFHSRLPKEGWKIHISCNLNNYKEIIQMIIPILFNKKINFKIIKSIEIYKKNSLKTGDRYSYGKFITIYPENEDDFIKKIEFFYNILKDFEGPYILSDNRYKNCKCLYYRYGSNTPSGIYNEYGRELFLLNGTEGSVIEDRKKVGFTLPVGISDPIKKYSENIKSKILFKKYLISIAVKFTPIGGIYRAIDKNNGKSVVIKETYPHTGLVDENTDSFTLRKNEIINLSKLSNFDFIPKIKEEFYDWQNHYLVLDEIEGDTFKNWVSMYNPIYIYDNKSEVKKYIIKLINIIHKLVQNIICIEKEGYYIPDLSPDNIIINEKNVFIIDLESLIEKDSKNSSYYYTLGFSKENNTPIKNVVYAISSLLLYGFNKNNENFSLMTVEEILRPLKYRYTNIQLIVEIVEKIRNSENLQDLIKYIELIKNKIINIEFEKKRITLLSKKIDYNKTLCNCEKNILTDLSIFESRQSIAKGLSGLFLTKRYLNINVNDTIIKEYFGNIEKRCLGLYYGLAGQLYLSALHSIENNKILNIISNNLSEIISLEDFSIDTGISGIGLSLIYYHIVFQCDNALKLAEMIARKCLNLEINNIIKNISHDLGFEKGLSGIAYFLLSIYSVTKVEEYYEKANSILEKCIEFIDIKRKKSIKMIIDSNEFSSPYIKNGEFGIIIILLYAQKFKNSTKRDFIIKKILRKNINYFSLSNGFYEGTGGMLYAYLKAYHHYNSKKYLNYAKMLVNDIYLTYKNGYFIQGYNHSNIHNYLYGNLSLISLMNMYENNYNLPLFPYILD